MNNQKTDKQNTAVSLFKIQNFQNSIHRTSLRFTYLEHLKQRYAKELLLIQTDTLTNPKLVSDTRKHNEANVGEKRTNTEKSTEATETAEATETPAATETIETPTQKKKNFFKKQFNDQSNVHEKITKTKEPAGITDTPEASETPETPETTETPEATMQKKHNIFKNFFRMYTEPKKEEVEEEEEEEKEVDGFVWIEDPLEKEREKERQRKKNSLKWKIRKYFLQNPEEEPEIKPQNDSDDIADDFVVIEPKISKEVHAESKFTERFIDFTAGSLGKCKHSKNTVWRLGFNFKISLLST